LSSLSRETWKPNLQLKNVRDVFNDKIVYTCNNFKDVVSLNVRMEEVCEKFDLLDPQKAMTYLEEFKENFEKVQVALGSLEEKLLVERTKKGQFDEQVQTINKLLKQLVNSVQQVTGADVFPTWSSPSTSHLINGCKASLIAGQQGCLLSSVGYSEGVHIWKLRVIARASTCMVGVAPSTVKKSGGYNCNTNGFYINFADGTLYSGPPFNKSTARFWANGIQAGSIVTLTLNSDDHTLCFDVDGVSKEAYNNLPAVELFLAWDNDTTGGSELEIIS